MNRFIAAIALVAPLLIVGATAVLGHAALQSSNPDNGATVPTPYTLTATFDEDLTPNGSSIVVQNASGAQVANGTVSTTDAKVMTIDLPALPDGHYEVLWTAVTADDNGVTRGTYSFNAGPVTASISHSPAPVQSAASGASSGTGNDLLAPLAVVIVIVVGIAAYFIYRNRRP